MARVELTEVCRIECCGPGPEAVAAWISGVEPGDRPVVLAGLAGSLHEEHPAGAARLVSGVVEAASGKQWLPSLRVTGSQESPAKSCMVTSAEHVVIDPAARRELRTRTGADLVDLESVAFAQAATAASWRWAIVRGISDDPQTALPLGIDRWIDSRGRSRPGVAAVALMARPGLVPSVFRLRSAAVAAMGQAANLIRQLSCDLG